MQVELTITLDVEPDEGDIATADKPRVLRSVREAIENAIRYGQGEGHNHEMSDSISIVLAEIGKATEVETIGWKAANNSDSGKTRWFVCHHERRLYYANAKGIVYLSCEAAKEKAAELNRKHPCPHRQGSECYWNPRKAKA